MNSTVLQEFSESFSGISRAKKILEFFEDFSKIPDEYLEQDDFRSIVIDDQSLHWLNLFLSWSNVLYRISSTTSSFVFASVMPFQFSINTSYLAPSKMVLFQ